MPDHQSFAYTFENLTNVVETLVERLGLGKFSLYVMDYGAPIGYRLALRRPDQVQALIVQNRNAYDEGLREFWDPIKKYWTDPRPENRTALHFLADAKSTRWQYENGVPDQTLLDPTTWLVDQAGLDRAGNSEIQMDLFYDYRTNVPLYPQFQAFFRKYQPPLVNPVKHRSASQVDPENSSSTFRVGPRLQLRGEAIRRCAFRAYRVG
jgi:pimeloyl-ACP methyl ester carboxylesterase